MDHDMHHDAGDGLEWEDLVPEINAQTGASNMLWKLVDEATGAESAAIDWAFTLGDRVKVRLVNTMDSDHPMHHPFHVHGAGRFLVLARDGEPTTTSSGRGHGPHPRRRNGSTSSSSSPNRAGGWRAIAEHNQDGMMFSFRISPA